MRSCSQFHMKISATLPRIPFLGILRVRQFAKACLVLTSVFSLGTTTASAQESAPVVPRIVSKMDNTQLVTLKGNTPAMAQKRFDQGALPDSTPANRIQLVLTRSADQEAALKQRIGNMQDPKSELFHKWLTPAEFGRQFGPADADVAQVTGWLQNKGFTINKVSQGKGTIDFSGTAGTIKSAFHTEMHTYVRNGVTFHSNSSDPQIPAALQPVVAGLVSLNDIQPKSNAVTLGTAKMNMKTHQATPEWNDGQQCGSVVNGQFVLVNCTLYPPAPGDLAVQYNLTSVYKAGTTGKGITVGILSASNIDLGVVQNYRTAFGFTNTANLPQVIIDGNDPGQNGASTEAYLDVEALAAMAPDATTYLYTSNGSLTTSGLVNAIIRGVDDNTADILNLSYGECEQQLGPSGNEFFLEAWEQAAAQGQTVFVAAGDSGSASCDNFNEEAQATLGLAVSGFASTPYDTAVGGSDFYYSQWAAGDPSAALQPQLTAAWGTTTSINPQASLIAPLPEQVWNEGYGLDVVNDAFGYAIVAGSGGASSCVTGSGVDPTTGAYGTCSAGYPKPSWQSGTGVPADGVRDLPDVSFFAANGTNLSFWPICASIYDCRADITAVNPGYSLQLTAIGGTSASSPAMAGVMALIDQTQKGRQGNANPTLYALATQFPNSFNDITIGSNNVPCIQGTPNCSLDSNGDGLYTLQQYSAGVGYDQASGLGSINGANLIANWSKITYKSTSTALSLTPVSIVHGSTVTVATTVTGSGGTPSGSVALTSTSTIPGQAGLGSIELTNGDGTGTTNVLPGGSYSVSGDYGGDSVYAASISPATAVTVTPESSAVSMSGGILNIEVYPNTLTSFSAGAAIPYVDSIYLDAAVVGKSGYGTPTGVVTFKDGSTTLGTANVDSGGVAEWITGSLAPGAHTITASYAGDGSFNASTSATGLPFTVTQGVPDFFVTADYSYTSSGPTIYAGQPFQVQANVSGGLNSPPPTGSATITFGPLTPQTVTLVPGATNAYHGVGFAFFTPTVPGTYVLSGTYTGDAAYQAAVDLYPTTITVVAPTLAPSTTTLTTSGTSFGPDGIYTLSTTVTGSVTNTVPTGAVNFIVGYATYQVQLDSTGKASAVIGAESLTVPTPVFAQYQGDTVYAQSSSTPITMSANTGDYTLVASSSNVVVASGATASSTLTIAEIAQEASGGLTGPVIFTCTPSTPSITCSFSNSPLNLLANGVQSTTQLTINTQIPVTASNQKQHGGLAGKGLVGGGIALAAIFLLFPVKRRSVARILMLALAFGISLSTVACSGNGSGPTMPIQPKYNNAAPGTYQVLVNTNLSGVQHSLVLNVIVQ